MLFPFVAGFIDHAIGILEQATMKKLLTMDSDLVKSITGYKSWEIEDDILTRELRRHIKEFKRRRKPRWMII